MHQEIYINYVFQKKVLQGQEKCLFGVTELWNLRNYYLILSKCHQTVFENNPMYTVHTSALFCGGGEKEKGKSIQSGTTICTVYIVLVSVCFSRLIYLIQGTDYRPFEKTRFLPSVPTAAAAASGVRTRYTQQRIHRCSSSWIFASLLLV